MHAKQNFVELIIKTIFKTSLKYKMNYNVYCSGINIASFKYKIFLSLLQVPNLQWNDVIAELDHKSFMINNKKGLRLLIQGLIKALNDTFPVKHIYKPWKNTEGQVSVFFLFFFPSV